MVRCILIFLVMLISPALLADSKGNPAFTACEKLRSNDAAIRREAIDELLALKGLVGYTIVKLHWIAEKDASVRKHLLEKFKKIGDHKYIADPDFPKEWVAACEQFEKKVKDERLQELRTHFPDEFKKIGS